MLVNKINGFSNGREFSQKPKTHLRCKGMV